MSAEFGEYLSAFEEEKLPDGRRRMVRNGHLPERQILTGIGAVDVRVPKARSRSGSAGTVPLGAGAAVRAPRRKRRCGGSVAVPARSIDGSDETGGSRSGR